MAEPGVKCQNCGAPLGLGGSHCRYCGVPTGHPVPRTRRRSPLPTIRASYNPPVIRTSRFWLLFHVTVFLTASYLFMHALSLPSWAFFSGPLLFVADIVGIFVWGLFRPLPSSRRAAAMWFESDRVNTENLARLQAEAEARLDPYNSDANANLQVLGELVGRYFPPTTVWNTDCWWNANLGWKRAGENSPWEPVVEVYQQERVRQACPPEVSTTAVYRSEA